jgi:hypothetical protein
MNEYIDYYYYELTNDDKKKVGIHSNNRLQLTTVFMKNGLIFNDIFFIHLEKKGHIVFFGRENPSTITTSYRPLWARVIIGNLNKFNDNYGKSYNMEVYGSEYNFLLFANDKYLIENEQFILYSKIPAWRDRYVELIFYARELCINDLPDDVIKYILQFITKIETETT